MSAGPPGFSATGDPRAKRAGTSTERQQQLFALAAGETVGFGPDPRLAPGTQATLIFAFEPAFAPWTAAESLDDPPCLLQLGPALVPGGCLSVAVTRELDALLISSSETKSTAIAADLREGARIVVSVSAGAAHVRLFGGKTALADVRVPFRLGDSKGAPVRLQLGSDSVQGGAAPFAGCIGMLMLFDRDIDALVDGAGLIHDWMHPRLESFFAGVGLEDHRDVAAALVGTALGRDDRMVFDFPPRALFWPDRGRLARWVIEDGAVQPQQVELPNVPREQHGIYSSACLYCITRIDGEPWLLGDQGQRFRLTYLGEGRCRAETADAHPLSDGTQAPLVATVEIVGTDRLRLNADGRWTNRTLHLFPLLVAPENTTLCDRNGHPVPDALQWPAESIVLERVPDFYDLTVGAKEPVKQAQAFKDAFSKRLPQLGMSSRGWDLTRMDAPLNLARCSGAQRDDEFCVFQQPRDNFYRIEVDVAVPYYCYSAPVNQTDGGSSTRMYRSASEFANNESTSYGANLGIGDKKLANFSFSQSKGYQQNANAEHTIAIHQSKTLRDVIMLDKRWLQLTDKFVTEVLEAADGVLGGQLDPSPFDRIFWAFGTHYPNAITYGERSYSLSVMDESALADVAESGTDIEAALTVPLPEGASVGADAGRKTETRQGRQSTFREQTEWDLKVGSHDDPNPILLDLRPILDLLQPPYLVDERLQRVLPHVAMAWRRYLEKAAGESSDGLILVQARLVSIRNLSKTQPCFVLGRAFLAGVTTADDWQIALPVTAEERGAAAIRIWASASDPDVTGTSSDPQGGLVRIEPDAIHQPDLAQWGRSAHIGIPRNRPDVVAAIGFTGQIFVMHDAQIRRELETEREVSSDDNFAAWAPGAAPATFKVKVEASPAAVADYEKNLAARPGFEFFGVDWIRWNSLNQPVPQADLGHYKFFTTDEYEGTVLREKVKLTDLSPGASFQTRTIRAGGVEVQFQVRKIDPMDLFRNAAAYVVGHG